ncbi:putative bifunctional diguanylate cyclase/phosphodiesterase [Thioalbus denitrificans]|uniref:PAS domain S-box-containing protein/diguanylate cyclase (GGDEF)-like protein n=1 Tax=Thioalbus denitrificans TaxID=547122 RepID=A0A369CIT6_9GAMM|nr:EAL domain-containing protein [Thioalbus denitrificans]RCX32995.1 PAS domain S-box-containing protein/diguanylate cyclase (GGDEF)-like protein [Thioalbus denitrificans]
MTTPHGVASGGTRAEELIHREQVKLLFGGLPLVLPGSVAVALVLAWAHSGYIHSGILTTWLAILILVSIARTLLNAAYHRRPPADDAHRWERRFLVGAVASGVVWGSAGLLLFTPGDFSRQAFLTLVLAGMAGGSLATLAPSWGSSASFISLCLLPLGIRHLAHGGELSLAVAAMVALYYSIMLLNARRMHNNLLLNTALRIEAAVREEALRESEERYRLIFSHSPLGMLHYDRNGVMLDCNEAFVGIVGSSRRQIIGLDMPGTLRDERLKAALRDSLASGQGYYEGIYKSLTAVKSTPIRGFFSGVRNIGGEIIAGVGIVEDFTERKAAEALIRRQAHYDTLTELPNRRLLLERLQLTLERSRRSGQLGALLFIDLDRFKRINDSLGHPVGDALLQETARRLPTCIRHQDIAARLGGDEFVVLLDDLGADQEIAAREAQQVAERVRAALSQPYSPFGQRLHVTPSIGIALFPAGEDSADDVLRAADTAMYRAKTDGRDAIRFFRPSMQRAADERLRLETDLRQAMEARRFTLHYQPQFDADRRVIGAEALLRWQREDGVYMPPALFIPVAEDIGLIQYIGDWVLEESCRQLREWDDRGLSGRLAGLSVNISPVQFLQPGFVDRVREVLAERDVDPARLEVELTEGVMLADTEGVAERMRALQALGVRISIDDFGTGYSSLAYLKRLPLRRLKIDQSFVRGIPGDRNNAAIVETILGMAAHLDLEVVAEGVETTAEFEFLRAHGCGAFQGYYLGQPGTAAELERRVQGQSASARQPAKAPPSPSSSSK